MNEAEGGGRLLSIPLVVHAGEGFPADVDIEPSAARYVGFYENQYGEQLVYVHEKDGKPTIYHGDYGWEPLAAKWPEISTDSPLVSPWVTGNLILNQGEVLWLASCLHASGALREATGRAPEPLERLALQLVEHSSSRQREHFDRQWALSEIALKRWQEKQQMPPSHEEDHYAEGAILVALGINAKQRRARSGVTKEIRERIEHEAAGIVREVQKSEDSKPPAGES